MPRGVKGSGKGGRAALMKDHESEAPAADSRVPTCRIDGAPLLSGGQCPACQRRAARFKPLIEFESRAKACDECGAPVRKKAFRGRRVCDVCLPLVRREAKHKKELAQAGRRLGS